MHRQIGILLKKLASGVARSIQKGLCIIVSLRSTTELSLCRSTRFDYDARVAGDRVKLSACVGRVVLQVCNWYGEVAKKDYLYDIVNTVLIVHPVMNVAGQFHV